MTTVEQRGRSLNRNRIYCLMITILIEKLKKHQIFILKIFNNCINITNFENVTMQIPRVSVRTSALKNFIEG